MFKNTAAKFMVFAFDTTNATAKTGDAANITCYVSKDYGTVTVLADTSATEMDSTNAKGYYLFDAAQGETNGDVLMVSAKSSTANIAVIGAPAVIYTRPTTGWLAPTTAGRTLDVASTGEAGLDFDNINSTTTATLNALTVTGALTVSNGIAVTCSTSNRSAITATGNGTGSGCVFTSGSGATGDGIQATSAATNGNGFALLGNGTGNGLKVSSTSGDAILTSVSTSGHGATFAGTGTTKHGINATGGATTSAGIAATGGGTSGAGVLIRTTSGHGVDIAATGTSMHGITVTGGNGGTSDGFKCVAGTGGVPIRGNITGDITGNLSGSVGSVTGAVGSVTGAVGSVTGSVGSVASGGITTASFGAGAINAAAINADTGLIIRANTATGSSSSTLVLDASASATDNFYINDWLVVTSGTGVGQIRRISAYTGSSKTATISPNWTTTPATNGTFTILPAARIDIAAILGTASVGTAGYVGIDWGQVTNQSTSVNLSATTINLVNTATTLTNAPSDSSGVTTLLSRLTSGRATNLDNLDAAITSRMATYTQPTGFLAATFPSGTIANTTNITAGTITTASNLTTNNDKTGYSLTQAFPTNFSSLSITAAGLVAITSNRKKNTAATYEFVMTDSTTGAVKTGLTVASVISKDGGAAASTTNSVTEIGLGQYQLVLTSAEMNANNIFMQFTATGAVTFSIAIQTQP